jgi:hypothetical protein
MTPSTRHQTVRLSRGRHTSPEDGACVMELASMLSEEPFSDHPPSVCPVIAAFMRVYNDAIDDDRRQDLYRYAAKVVDSRAGQEVTALRAAHLTERTRQLRKARRRWPLGVGFLIGMWWTPGFTPDASFAVSEFIQRGEEGHQAALGLVDEMLAIGPGYDPLVDAVSVPCRITSDPDATAANATLEVPIAASSPISSASSPT